MTFLEKIEDIKRRLLLNDDALTEIMQTSKKQLEKKEISDELVEKIADILNIEKEILLDEEKKIDVLNIRYKLDMNKYKNIISAYSEILKSYFTNSSHKYVLTKLKKRNMVTSFLDLFFKNDKKSIINEMNSFEPSYLISKDNSNLLVQISNGYLEIHEIQLNEDGKSFIYDNYRYKKANELTLK